jgi:soluble lytic murein transglycosylase-like protein
MLSRFALGLSCLALAAPARAQTYVIPLPQAVHMVEAAPAAPISDYDDLIVEHARLNGVRTNLVRAVIQVESRYNPGAVSPKGAIGLMQLMPATIQQFGVRNAFSPSENIRAGVAYLRQLLDRYDNNEELALAAYNAGPGAVDKHGESVPPYPETQHYVSKVTELAGVKATRVPGTQMYRIVQVVDGRERVLYSNNPDARFSPAALSQADQDARTPALELQTSSISQSP